MKRMNTKFTTLLAGAILLAGALTIPALAQGGTGNGSQDNRGSGLPTYLGTLPVAEVSAGEIEGLLYTYEEEKLARDVYTALGAKWNARIFGNIAKAEQAHMDAVKLLLDRYAIVCTAAALPAGSFEDGSLRQLYADLVAQGDLSIGAALEAGATIEDLDLRDVTALLATSDNVDLDALYQNLAKGSRNHLRSFVDQLAMLSLVYLPLYLDQATFDAIVAAEMERGVYDAAGVPVTGTGGSGVCDGTGHGAGHGGGSNGNGGSNGTGTGNCDGTCDGSGSGGNGSGNQGGGRP